MEEKKEKIKVLVVDDEKLIRFTISAYLRVSGYAVTEAATPAEAIGAFKRDQFHVVVSDISMGDMDGFMLRDAIRSISPDVPIIFLTAMQNDSGNAFMTKVMEDIHSYYVAKSAPRTVLIAKIQQAVKAMVAEQNVKKLEKQLERSLALACFVQQSMLPQWTRITDRYTYTCCWTPYSGVSGDLLEWYPITPDSALFVIGDISGHGTTAALAMTAMQAFLKQFAQLSDRKARDVHAIASRIHEFISENLRDLAYMATTVLYVNTAENRVRYINCGNPEPFCFHNETGERIRMNPDRRGGLPPGLVADAEYREADVIDHPLRDDDVLIVTSDGIYDMSSDEAGLERPPAELLHELYSVAVRTNDDVFQLASAIPYRVINALRDLGYVHQQDDNLFFCFSKSISSVPGDRIIEVNMQPNEIDRASRACGEYAAEITGDGELGMKVDLLVNEHLMNVYRHGYDDFGRQHEISILGLARRGDELHVGVWDRGAEWTDVAEDSEAAADAALEEQNAALAGNGRGRAILRKIAHEIKCERFMNLNKTVFKVRIGKREG
jgi:phosphoserine phosphatase RsbU/P